MTLDEILGTVSVALEHDGVKFRLVPFTNNEVMKWNRITFSDRPENVDVLDHTEAVHRGQMELIAKKMQFCVSDGKSSKVTPKWVGDNFPQTILQEIAEFFANGVRPAWAGERGN